MREKKLERLQEQNKREVRGANLSLRLEAEASPGPKETQISVQCGESQEGNEREQGTAFNHREKKVKLGPCKRRAGLVPAVSKIKRRERTAEAQLDEALPPRLAVSRSSPVKGWLLPSLGFPRCQEGPACPAVPGQGGSGGSWLS